MKKLQNLCLLLIFFANGLLFAQGTQAYTTEQFFLDKTYKKVESAEKAYYTQTFYYQGNKIMMDLNLSKNRMPIAYKEHIVVEGDTIANGPFIKWYENTKKAYEMKFVNGVIVGDLNTFYENGKPKRADKFDEKGNFIEGKCFDKEENEITHFPYKVAPIFEQELASYFKENMKYPKKAKQRKIEGLVNLILTIDEEGTVVNTKVVNSPHKLLTEEAERLVCAMPNWEAGKIEDEATTMPVKIAIEFKL